MKKRFNITILSKIFMLLSLVMFVTSSYAWFYAGKSIYDITISTQAVDCVVELFRVHDDYFFNGTYNNSFSEDFEEFTTLYTTKTKSADVNQYLSIKKEGDVSLYKLEEDRQDIDKDEGTYTTLGYTLSYNATSSDDSIYLEKVNPNDEGNLFYNLDKVFPSSIVTYAVSVSATQDSNSGKLDIGFTPTQQEQSESLDEVVTLNIAGTTNLLANSSYAQGLISVFPDDKLLEIGKGETLWLFFYFKFETLDSLCDLSDDFEEMDDLNDYAELPQPKVTITFTYYLTETETA